MLHINFITKYEPSVFVVAVLPKLNEAVGLKLLPKTDVFWLVVPNAFVPNPVEVVAVVPKFPKFNVEGLVPNKELPVLVVDGWLKEKALLVFAPRLNAGLVCPKRLPV